MSNQEHEAQIALALAQRAYRYTLLHILFGTEPTADITAKTFSDETKAAFADIDPIIACIEHHESEATDGEFLDALRDSYAELFYHMGEHSVSAWESPYVDENDMLFQESTLDVRHYYHEAGLQLAAEKKFPDDHIAAMMDYLAQLGSQTFERFADGQDAKVAQLARTQRAFINTHLLHWVGKFADRVNENDHQGVYAAFAEGLALCVQEDYDLLGKAIAEVDASDSQQF